MLTLSQHLAHRSVQSLLAWADSLDPNHSWDELVESDPSISADQLAEFMLTAYDDEDTVAWINAHDDIATDDERSNGPRR